LQSIVLTVVAQLTAYQIDINFLRLYWKGECCAINSKVQTVSALFPRYRILVIAFISSFEALPMMCEKETVNIPFLIYLCRNVETIPECFLESSTKNMWHWKRHESPCKPHIRGNIKQRQELQPLPYKPHMPPP